MKTYKLKPTERPPGATEGQAKEPVLNTMKRHLLPQELHETAGLATVDKMDADLEPIGVLDFDPKTKTLRVHLFPKYLAWFPATNKRHLNLNAEMQRYFCFADEHCEAGYG